MAHEKDTSTDRRPYRKPRLEKVELKAGETVLSFCKANNGVLPAVFGNYCGAVFRCNIVGS